MEHQFTGFEYPDNEESEDETTDKPDAKKKKPLSKKKKAQKSHLDLNIRGLSLVVIKISALAVGLSLFVLGGNAVLAIFGFIPSTPATSPTGQPYNLFFIVPIIIPIITWGVTLLIGGSLYKIFPVPPTKEPILAFIVIILKLAVALTGGYFAYDVVSDLLLQFGWTYPVLESIL